MFKSMLLRARIIIKKGDIFSAKIDDRSKKYFQYVSDDETQLDSNVIRVYKKVYKVDENPSLPDIVKDEIDFYVHCLIKLGLQLEFWTKVGAIKDIGIVDVIFRHTEDYGRAVNQAPVRISNKWYVWRINDPEITRVGKLIGENRNAEIGLVINPKSIVHRMKTGQYDFEFYPEFEWLLLGRPYNSDT
ncbi:hypothetical protein AB6805_13725 [Chitinophaga sp. RCC_12]|uniref:hypothetical protein n=1 Tax=Chitinophaga sp. RCC_12 TaxID=3239226 RepID=UPI003525E726